MNFNNEEMIYTANSMSKVVEISKKITEILDNMNYNNNEMLITKEHIKHNLAELIGSSNIKNSIHYQTERKKMKFSDRYNLESGRRAEVSF